MARQSYLMGKPCELGNQVFSGKEISFYVGSVGISSFLGEFLRRNFSLNGLSLQMWVRV